MELTFDRVADFMAEGWMDGTCIHQTEHEKVYQSNTQGDDVLTFRRLMKLEESLKQLNPTYQIVAYTHKQQEQSLVEVCIEKKGTVLLLSLLMSDLETDNCMYYRPMIVDMDKKRFLYLGEHAFSIFPDHKLLIDCMVSYVREMNEFRLHFATNAIQLKEADV